VTTSPSPYCDGLHIYYKAIIRDEVKYKENLPNQNCVRNYPKPMNDST